MRAAARLLAHSLTWVAGWAAVASAAAEIGPGAYCPLPKPGETPACLEPARGHYGEFFTALEGGEPAAPDVERLEADLALGGASEQAYLALSSLAYGYYRLAQLAAATPGEDPAIAARLERWNALLSRAYAGSADPRYREAVRTAALDLRQRSPALRLRCLDSSGNRAECDSTEAVLRGFDDTTGRVGVRGALQRLLERLVGRDGS